MTAPVPGASAVTIVVTAGETVTAGQAVYQDQTTGLYKKCDATTALGAAAQIVGLAICGAIANQPLVVMVAGDLVTGGTVTAGIVYQVGLAGAVNPTTDATTGWFAGIVGSGLDAATLRLAISPSSTTTAHA